MILAKTTFMKELDIESKGCILGLMDSFWTKIYSGKKIGGKKNCFHLDILVVHGTLRRSVLGK